MPPRGYLFAQAAGRWGRLCTEVSRESIAEPFVLGQGLFGPPGAGVKAHEGCVRSFVGWLFAHRHPERLDGRPVLVSFFVEPREIYEKSEVQLSQCFTPAFGPILIAVPWQQVASVEVDGRPVGRRVAE